MDFLRAAKLIFLHKGDSMHSIQTFLEEDHRRCDQLFADMEEKAQNGNTGDSFAAFKDAMEFHFCLEENILFPAMTEITGSEAGPIVIMKMEHNQMRNLFTRMEETVENDPDEFLSLCETLNILIQQHNVKEEQVLYPMAERLLENSLEKIIADFSGSICRKD